MDKRVFPIRSRDELDLIRYTIGDRHYHSQDLSNGFWKVLQPSNVDLEMRDAFFMVNTLSTLSSILRCQPQSLRRTQTDIGIRRLQGDVMRLRVFDAYDQEGVQDICVKLMGWMAPLSLSRTILNGLSMGLVKQTCLIRMGLILALNILYSFA